MGLLLRFLLFSIVRFIGSVHRRYRIYVYSMKNNCSIELGANFTGDLSRLKVGEGTVINGNANFRFKDGVIEIGKECLLANNVTIVANSYVVDGMKHVSPKNMYSKKVVVGNYVWIGGNVIVMPGVVIGENSIIGASSLVNKNVPPNEVWGGVPAKFLYKKK